MNIIKLFTTKVSLTCQGITRYYKNKRLKKRILSFYNDNITNDEEIIAALNYIKKHEVTVFPYLFNNKYNSKNVTLYKDESSGLYYVLRQDKKLYLRRDITYKTARNLYNSLLIEQDPESPHRYLTKDFDIKENDILVDIGCAEGFLPLDVIEKVKKVYLFEYEDLWIEALLKTFAPWKNKVEIIKGYVSDKTDDSQITIDEYFKNIDEKPTFIKIDVEGAEMKVLKGMEQTINLSKEIKLAVCTYHRKDDYNEITSYISSKGLDYETSNRYMLFENVEPYFRRGLIRVVKQSTENNSSL